MQDQQDFDFPKEYPPIDESETDLCRTLWVCVAVQAVIDARSDGKKPEHRREKEDAREWLQAKDEEQSEFAEMCSMAGLDFQKTRTKLLELATDDSRSLDFRCLKKTLMVNRNSESRSNYLKRSRKNERLRMEKSEKREN
jgi:hypothetical protein